MTAGPEEGSARLTAAELQQKAASGSFWTAVSALVSLPLAFAANAVVARFLGVADYGRLAFLTLALSLAVQVTNFGVSDAVIRWGAGHHAGGSRGAVDTLLRKSLGYHLLVQMPLLVITVLWLARDAGTLVVVALLVSVIMPAALGSAALSLTIESRMASTAKLAMAIGLVTQVAVATTAVVAQTPASVWAVRSVAGSVLLPLNFLLLDRARRRIAVRPAVPRAMPDGFWRYASYSFAAATVALLVFSRSELFVLNVLGMSAALGVFALAFGLSQQVTAPADAMLGPLLPAIAGLVAEHPDRRRTALLRATRFSALICALIVGVVCPALYFLIPALYGADFADSAALFLPLAVISCVQSISHPVTTFTRARGRNDVLLKAYTVALVVNVAAAFGLIVWIGVWGAVIANGSAQLVALVLVSRLELRHLGVPVADYLRTLTSFGVGLVAAGAAVGLTALASAPVAAAVVSAGVLGGALTVIGLRAAGVGFSAGDEAALMAALPGPLERPASFTLRLLPRPATGHSPRRNGPRA